MYYYFIIYYVNRTHRYNKKHRGVDVDVFVLFRFVSFTIQNTEM